MLVCELACAVKGNIEYVKRPVYDMGPCRWQDKRYTKKEVLKKIKDLKEYIEDVNALKPHLDEALHILTELENKLEGKIDVM